MDSRWSALALALVLLVSTFSGIVPTTASAAPGMVGVADDNIESHVPQHAQDKMPSASEFRGNVMTSDGASTMHVDIVTEAQAKGVNCQQASKSPQCDGEPKIALELTDDVTHDGRTVAVPKDVVESQLGYTPQMVTIKHSSGDTYTAPVRAEGRLLKFDVKGFSTNTVTFSGEVSVTGNPAVDGSTYTYDINDLDSVGNYTIDVTGSTATEWDNETASLTPGSSTSVAIAGTTDPRGPSANSNPVLEVTGQVTTATTYQGTAFDTLTLYGTRGGTAVTSEVMVYEQNPGVVNQVTIDKIQSTDPVGVNVDVYMSCGRDGSGIPTGATLVKDNWAPASSSTETVVFDSSWDASQCAGNNPTVQFDTVSAGTDGNYVTVETDEQRDYNGDGTVSEESQANYGSTSYYRGPADVTLRSAPTNIDASDDTTLSHSFGNFSDGQTKTAEFDVGTDTTQLDFTGTGGSLDITLKLEEVTETVNPTITVNGNSTDYAGTLADGDTASLTTDTAWVQEGANNVSVAVSTGVNSDAPTPEVGLDYSHDATDKQSVTYDAEKWSERYNVSKTYGADQSAATLTIPFDGNVIEVRNLEKRVNGGSWQSVGSSDYSLDNTELTVQLGSVNAGDKVEVRTTGSKVVVVNGEITVTEPSTMGESLDSKIRLDSWGSDSYISLGGTPDGTRVHTTYNESWTSPASYSEITAASYNRLYMPDAGAGSTTRVTPTALTVGLDSNEVEIEVIKTGKPFKFKVRPGQWGGDAVDYTFHNTVSGEDYILYSVSDDVQIDSATAQSPVTLSDDDSSETLEIFEDSGSTSSDDGGDTGFTAPIGPIRTDDGGIPDAAIMLSVAVGALVALYFLQRRVFNEGSGRILGVLPRSPLFLTGGALVSFVTIDYASGGAITSAVGRGLEQVMPVLGLLGGALAAYYFYKRFIKGRDQTIVVRGSEK